MLNKTCGRGHATPGSGGRLPLKESSQCKNKSVLAPDAFLGPAAMTVVAAQVGAIASAKGDQNCLLSYTIPAGQLTAGVHNVDRRYPEPTGSRSTVRFSCPQAA